MPGPFDDLIPAAGARPAAPPAAGVFDDLIPAQRPAVGAGEVASRAGSGLLNSAIAYAQRPIVGALSLADMLSRAFGGSGDLTTRYGDTFVQPNINAIEAASVKPGENVGDVGRAIIGAAPAVGKMGADLLEGGVVGNLYGRVVPAVAESAPLLAQIVDQLRRGAAVGVPAGFNRAAERTSELRSAGVGPIEAGVQGAVSGAGTVGQFALPASAGSSAATLPARIASRGAQGAALNAAAGAAQRGVEDALLPDQAANLRQGTYNPEAAIADALGGFLFGQMGQRVPLRHGMAEADRRLSMGYDRPGADAIVAERTVPPQVSLTDLVSSLTGAPRNYAAPDDAAAAIRAEAEARKVREQGLQDTFGPILGKEAQVYPDLARAPINMEQRAEQAIRGAGESPEGVANAFDRSRLEAEQRAKGRAPLDERVGPEDARTLKADLGQEDIALIERYMGVPADELAGLGPNSQRRLLARAMEAQGRDQEAAGRGPFASQDIYGGHGVDETGPASPASKPLPVGDRAAPESRTFDEMGAAAQQPPDPAAVKRKQDLLQQLEQARNQREALLGGDQFKDLQRRSDLGETMTDKEVKTFYALRRQADALARRVFDLESRIYVTEGRSEAGSRAASGVGDRPFLSVEPDQGYDGRLGGDAQPGESREQYFRRKAEEKAQEEMRASIDRLEQEWRARQQARAQQQARQEGQRRRGEGEARNRYANAERSANAVKGEGGRFRVDADGFVMSDKGAPIWFAHQRDAGWWILKTGNKSGSDQIFQIANHPSGTGFTVEVRGHQEPPKGGKGSGSGNGEQPKGASNESNLPALRGEVQPAGERGADNAPRSGEGGAAANAPQGQGGVEGARGGGEQGIRGEGAAPQGGVGAGPAPNTRRAGSDFLMAVRKGGGLDPSVLADMGIDKPMNANKRLPGLVRKGGMTDDRLVEWAIDNGWLSEAEARRADAEDPGGAHEKVREMIRAAFRGEDPARFDGGAGQDADFAAARARADRQALEDAARERGIDPADKSDEQIVREMDEADMLAELRDNSIPDQSAQQFADQAAVARAVEIDEAAVERMAMAAGDDDVAFRDSIRRFLDEHDENPASASARGGGEGAADADAQQRADSAATAEARGDDADGLRQQDGAGQRGDSGEAPPDAGRPDFDLEQPTRSELELRDLERRRAAAERERVDAAPPPEGFTLTGSDSARDQAAAAGQRDFLDESRGKLYANPIGPAVQAVVAGVKRMLGSGEQWREYASHLVDVSKALFTNPRDIINAKMIGEDGQNKLAAIWRWYNEDLGRRARIIVEKAGNSPTARRIVDMMDFEMGRGEGTTKVFREAMQERENAAYNAIGPALSAVDKLGESLRKAAGASSLKRAEFHKQAWEKVIERIENPNLARQGEIGRVAGEVEKWLKAQRDMQVKAGVEMGDVGRVYFPVKYLPDQIAGREKAFVDDATRAYIAEGFQANDAAAKAKALLDLLTLGDPSGLTGVRSGVEARATRERAFTTQTARNLMRKWRDMDGRDVLLDYAHNAAKRATVAERFGDNFSKWREMEEKIRAEGGSGAIPALREMVEVGAGINRTRGFGSDMADSARMAMTMGSLEKSVLPNMMELVTPLATTNGSIRAGLTALRTNIHSVLSAVGMLPKSQRREAVRELMEAFGALSSIGAQQQSMLRYSGAEVARNRLSDATQKFFDGIGLNQLTEAQRVSAGDIGAVWFDSLAKSVLGNGAWKAMFANSDMHHLRDMGVPAGKERAFAEFVADLKGKVPDAATLRAKGEMGQLYADALRRFVHTTIQHGDAMSRPSWASTPWGSLVYQFGAYMGTFHKNVIRRQYNNLWEAAAAGKGYTTADRLALAGGMVPGMMMMGAASYLVMAARDDVFNELAGTKRNLTDAAKVERAITNANLVGKYGRIFEQVTQQRYGQGASSLFLPPGAQQLAKGIDAMMRNAMEGEKSNSGERATAKWVFNTVLEPAWQIALSAGPGLPAGAASVALRTLAPSAAEGPFVDEFAGAKRTAERNKPVKGVSELVFGDKEKKKGATIP